MYPSPELVASAYHEAAHAIAVLWAFDTAPWLPTAPPLRPVRYIEINGHGGGTCVGMDIYSMKWPIDCIKPRYRPLMERQVCIHLSGGIAEAIDCGILRGHDALRFAEAQCNTDADLTKAADVCRELFRLTCYRFEARDFADRTMEMLLERWPAVRALASALVRERRIEGRRIEQIIDSVTSSDGAMVYR